MLIAVALMVACGSQAPAENASPASVTDTRPQTSAFGGELYLLDSQDIVAQVRIAAVRKIAGGGGGGGAARALYCTFKVTGDDNKSKAVWTCGDARGHDPRDDTSESFRLNLDSETN
jgi:hypothetical protein